MENSSAMHLSFTSYFTQIWILSSIRHKVLIYTEHHSVCPFVGIGTPPTTLPQASVPSPPPKGGGGNTRLWLWGWGSPNSDDWRKSLALCLLCGIRHFRKVESTIFSISFYRSVRCDFDGHLRNKKNIKNIFLILFLHFYQLQVKLFPALSIEVPLHFLCE